MEKHRYYRYFDERTDDFANDGINGKPTPDDFDYLPRNILFRIFKPVVYYLYMLLILLIIKPITGVSKVHGAKVLRNRRDMNKGYFIFGNHTTFMADALLNPILALPRQAYVVTSPDTLSIPCMKTFLRMLGVMPNPSSRTTHVKFIEATRHLYDKGNPISIYPEAHIWPRYNGVRDFPDVSFHLPAELGAPCFVKSTVYHKDRKGHTKPEVWYDGPFYPYPDLPIKKAQKDLRDRIYNQMLERCKDSELDVRYHYEKVDNPELVGSEFIKQ